MIFHAVFLSLSDISFSVSCAFVWSGWPNMEIQAFPGPCKSPCYWTKEVFSVDGTHRVNDFCSLGSKISLEVLPPGSVSVLFRITHYYRRQNWQAPGQYAELKERHNKVWQINAKWFSPGNITKNPGDKNLYSLLFKPWHLFNLLFLIPDLEGLSSFEFELKMISLKQTKIGKGI